MTGQKDDPKRAFCKLPPDERKQVVLMLPILFFEDNLVEVALRLYEFGQRFDCCAVYAPQIEAEARMARRWIW